MTDDRGVILINVLVALALGATVVVLMFTSQETLLDRTRRAANASQAEALALGAETSAVTALRRDAIEAPDTDHYAESWTIAAQEEVAISAGLFSVRIEDAQSRFNVNLLAAPGVAPQLVLRRLLAVLELPETAADTMIAHLARNGPQTSLDHFTDLPDDVRAVLAPHVAFLPRGGTVNVNTAGLPVLAAVTGSATTARQLLKKRERSGFLTKEDLLDAGVIALTNAGFTSDVYDVTVKAEVDGTEVILRSRILRAEVAGQPVARVISRRFGVEARSSDADFTRPDGF
ncbi:General secretion pathway protein K [Sulfitobacter sp. THAF37]|uniref:general secretion pathway protein GspK n=1 Tax=Sulfitobacter sp. THAF37 TaxID=2587855 RepID=UPI00126958FF|nr:type II secretion system protein GspK [Sulfitobacter sp. THAF37]QFT58117.1 General secretion pathway protein K [Sulfitobacter sp. THAF37]